MPRRGCLPLHEVNPNQNNLLSYGEPPFQYRGFDRGIVHIWICKKVFG